MKGFFKIVLGTITGLTLFLFTFFLFVLIISPSEDEITIDSPTLVSINLSGDLSRTKSIGPMDFFNDNENISIESLRTFFETTSKEENINGVFLQFSSFNPGLAVAEELREILTQYQTNGGKIYTHSDYYSQIAYYIASAADSIYLSPAGSMDWKGLSAEVTFFKKAMDKLGVEMQIIKHGKYKSAVEPFIKEGMSPENRIQTELLINQLWGEIVSDISISRSIPEQDLNRFADNISISNSTSALENNFITDVIYLSNLKDRFKEKNLKLLSFNDLPSIPTPSKSYKKERIGIYYAEGEIVDGKSEDGKIGGSTFCKDIEKLTENDKIKAVVLYVNSPGGSALASDNMWHSLIELKKKKPLVVYMSNYAASGGYYISACADSIFAKNTTVTGSIGVFGMIPNAEKLMSEKIGISTDVVSSNQHSNIGSIFKPLTNFEMEIMQQSVEDVYSKFITVVRDGRSNFNEIDEVDSIGQGRVWTGIEAVKIGLVDKIGGLNDAIQSAATLANLKDFRTVSYPEKKSDIEMILDQIGSSNMSLLSLSPESTRIISYLEYLKSSKGIQARPDYFLEIN